MSYMDHIAYWESGERIASPLGPFPCPAGDFPQVEYDLGRLSGELDRFSIAQGPATLWRYAAVLPIEDVGNAVSLGEGWTPLLSAPELGAQLGLENLLVKDEGRNPSGTFKDRGAAVAVSRFKELGVETIIHNSSGNAGGAWAMYAARAGIRCVNILPDDVLPGSLQQSVLAGAATFILDGPWREAGAMVAEAAQANGWMDMRTLKEPYRLEGKKTMGYEIAEQMAWQLPDVLVYPCGGGLGAVAIYKAFREMQAMGWVADGPLPKLILTQYEGCAPIVKAFEEGADQSVVWTDLDVLPGGLKSTHPPGDKAALKLVRETAGTAVAVSAADSLDAAALLARTEGIFACPESATTLVGLKRALADGVVGAEDRVLTVITGNGLKSIPVFPDVSAARIQPGEPLDADAVAQSPETSRNC